MSDLRTRLIRLAHADPSLRPHILPLVSERVAAWENLPEGWTEESVQSFWDSLTGDVKHKITKCMDQMEGKVTDTGAFCGSLASQVGYRAASGLRMTYQEAFAEAVEKANRLRAPVELRKDAFGGFSTSLVMVDPRTGQPREAVRGELIQPGTPLSRRASSLDATAMRRAAIRVAHEDPTVRADILASMPVTAAKLPVADLARMMTERVVRGYADEVSMSSGRFIIYDWARANNLEIPRATVDAILDALFEAAVTWGKPKVNVAEMTKVLQQYAGSITPKKSP